MTRSHRSFECVFLPFLKVRQDLRAPSRSPVSRVGFSFYFIDNGRIKAIKSVFSRMRLRVWSSTYGNYYMRYARVSAKMRAVSHHRHCWRSVNSRSVKSTMRSRGQISLRHASHFATVGIAGSRSRLGVEFNRRDRHCHGVNDRRE